MNKNIEDNNFPKVCLLFTDEATSTRGGVFNTHNLHIWQNKNHHVVHQSHHQHRFSVIVRAGIIGNNLVGHYLVPTCLTGDMYEVFMRQVLPELLDDAPSCIGRLMWFHQDGAPAHTSRNVRQYLDHTFPNRWRGRFELVSWLARSQDLTFSDFYLWSHKRV